MNKDKIIELFRTGGSFNVRESKFYHSSFRKGWRKMAFSNISLQAAEKALQEKLITENGVTRFA